MILKSFDSRLARLELRMADVETLNENIAAVYAGSKSDISELQNCHNILIDQINPPNYFEDKTLFSVETVNPPPQHSSFISYSKKKLLEIRDEIVNEDCENQDEINTNSVYHYKIESLDAMQSNSTEFSEVLTEENKENQENSFYSSTNNNGWWDSADTFDNNKQERFKKTSNNNFKNNYSKNYSNNNKQNKSTKKRPDDNKNYHTNKPSNNNNNGRKLFQQAIRSTSNFSSTDNDDYNNNNNILNNNRSCFVANETLKTTTAATSNESVTPKSEMLYGLLLEYPVVDAEIMRKN
jgi:hypothetical protein